MKRLCLRGTCGAVLAAAVLTGRLSVRAEEAAPPARPVNLLFILTDDQRWDTIHALGNPDVKTPALDRLVRDGFTFQNAYCMGSMVGAVCLPSRTMIATGRSLWRIPNGGQAKAPPGAPVLPRLFNEAGYATFHCGKAGNACTFSNAEFATNIATRTHNSPLDAQTHADAVIDFLQKHDRRRPFFVCLAPPVPHDPRLAPAEYARMYDPRTLPLPKSFLPRHPFDNGELYVRDEMLAPFPRTAEAMRGHLADYYACITHLDAQVGRILQTLKERGMAGDTVVVFSSDQGLAVGGAHGLMGKQNLYETNKPPLVFCGPGIPHGRSEALVYLYDLLPTFCGLAGIAVPEAVEGKSLVPVLRGEKTKVRDRLFGAYRSCQRMVRDERWKLIKYHVAGRKHVQLFDLREDPEELTDLAGRPESAGRVAELEKLLEAARKEFGDPVDFEGAGGPASVRGGARPKPKAKAKTAR